MRATLALFALLAALLAAPAPAHAGLEPIEPPRHEFIIGNGLTPAAKASAEDRLLFVELLKELDEDLATTSQWYCGGN